MRACTPHPIGLDDKLALISDHWNPRIVAHFNANEVRLVKIQGEFTWHSHSDTDELFLVLRGDCEMEFRDGAVRLGQNDMIIVPRGVEHRPGARMECCLLVLDRVGEPNTGVNPSGMTRARLDAL